MKTMKTAKRAFAMMCAAAIASCALAGTAFAATVHGADYHGAGSALESGNIDVLDVDGQAGETVFLTVKYNDQAIARNLPYTIGENAEAGDESTWAGIATLDIDGLDLNALDGSYTIEAYADRPGKVQLYAGAIYGVYADLPDGTVKLVGTRTADAAELAGRTFDPAETLFAGGHTYRLVGPADGAEASGALHFASEEYNEATTVDGVVKYTNAAGDTIASVKIPGLAYGESRTVEIPSVITADNGDVYRTVFFKNSVEAVNPGQTSFSIYCAQMSEADKAAAGYYIATIKMTDDEGRVIATDSVDVTGEFIYTAPRAIYKTEMVDGEEAVVTYRIDGDPTIRLSAANDGVLNRERTITVRYTADPLEAPEANVTFNLLDGSKRVNDKDRILGVQQLKATEDNPTVEPVDEIEVNGTTYYLAGDPADYAYTLRSGKMPTIDAFYVPEGYEVPGAYDVTVNYVNFLTGAVVESHTYTSDAGANARIEIETPAEFSADGVDYVRLDGQDGAIRHSYYSGIASYTVYYRDVNDTLTSGTVINTIRVVYVDGTTTGGTGVTDNGITIIAGTEEAAGTTTTTVVEGGTTTGTTAGGTAEGAAGATEGGTTEGGAAGTGEGATAGGAAGGAAAGAAAGGLAEGVTAFQLNAGRTYNVFDGADNNATLTNEEGVNSNTERIEDNETPLASGFDKGGTSTAASSFMASAAWVIPVAIGIVVVAGGLLAFMAIRRRKNSDMYEL